MSRKGSTGELRRRVRQAIRKLNDCESFELVDRLLDIFENRNSVVTLVELNTHIRWQKAESNREAYRLWGNLLRDVYRYELKAGMLPAGYQVEV